VIAGIEIRKTVRAHGGPQAGVAKQVKEEGLMLAQQPVDVMLTASDLGVAKRFYGDRIGLDVLIDTEDFVTFGCGGDSRLIVTRTSSPSDEQQTKASWRVGDIAAEVAELRARGVEVAEYDEPGLKTTDGVADVGFALSAWFVDPGGNTIGLLQFKNKELG
jgi:catechol-2,3-dioxygenase